MKNISRREFISQMLLILPASIITNSVYETYKSSTDKLELNPSFIQECRIVLHEWQKREILDPAHYLHKVMIESQHKKWSLIDATKSDFQNKNFFTVNGLQLGKTEAAFLALLVS